MDWLWQTLALSRARYGAMLLSTALALLPTNLLVAGAVRFGVGALGAPLPAAEVSDQRAADTSVPPESGREVLKREAGDSKSARPPPDAGALLDLAVTAAGALALLLFGLALAQAALVPVVLGTADNPTHAWAAVAARMGALFKTGVLGAFLIALGTVLFVLPGIAAMVAFAFAMPAVMVEGMSGSAALDRSWRLMSGRLAAVLACWALLAMITAASIFLAGLLPAGPLQLMAGTLLRTLTYPLPLAALVVLYAGARRGERSVHPPDLGARIVVG